MNQFKVYQVRPFNNEEINQLNSLGWSKFLEVSEHGRLKLKENKELEDVENMRHVLNIVANDLEDAFAVGNGFGSKGSEIARLDTAHSISVGDVIYSVSEDAYYNVDDYGFSKL